MTKCNCKEELKKEAWEKRCKEWKQTEEFKQKFPARHNRDALFYDFGFYDGFDSNKAKLQKAIERIKRDGSTDKYADTWIIKEKAIRILKEEFKDV